MLASSLATRTRERSGINAKVIWPVRWDHSEVTSRTPTTGRSTEAGCSATLIIVRKSRSAASATAAVTATAMTVITTTEARSQKPALVSVILRSSTRVRRARPGRV
jgi:hypothetical protein